ncbi:hypothetical protein EV641_10918 [Rhodococcus sp. SMB37]|nr:hypothetical protein EV641_10918 [Rhodococcus sp. SMB37]
MPGRIHRLSDTPPADDIALREGSFPSSGAVHSLDVQTGQAAVAVAAGRIPPTWTDPSSRGFDRAQGKTRGFVNGFQGAIDRWVSRSALADHLASRRRRPSRCISRRTRRQDGGSAESPDARPPALERREAWLPIRRWQGRLEDRAVGSSPSRSRLSLRSRMSRRSTRTMSAPCEVSRLAAMLSATRTGHPRSSHR